MNDFSIILIIVCIFMAFLATLIVIVVINPNKVKVNAKRKDDNIVEEVAISLENEIKK